VKPVRLYVYNFMCFDTAYIDFTQFSSALIVGKIEGNDSYSNGVGKTSLFKAIEYVLFNQADVTLENIVRDDSGICRIVMDFLIGDQEYRLARSRTKKGTTDLTLLQRNAVPSLDEEAYHRIEGDAYIPFIDKKETKHFWKDISGSRAGDTEKDLTKLIKFTSKSFRSTVHFMQNDMTGLPTASPEKRKGILKDALNLLVYIKLEKLAKERAALIIKDIDKHQILIEGLGHPDNDITSLTVQLQRVSNDISDKQTALILLQEQQQQQNEQVAQFSQNLSLLESKFASLLTQEETLIKERDRSEISVKEYTSKKSNTIKMAKDLVTQIKSLKETHTKLSALNYADIERLTTSIEQIKEQSARHDQIIKSKNEELQELLVPLPVGSKCKHCRKPLSETDRDTCQKHINQDKSRLQQEIQNSKQTIFTLHGELAKHQQAIASLKTSKQQLQEVATQITIKEAEYQEKNANHKQNCELLDKFKLAFADKSAELLLIQEQLKTSSLAEAKLLKADIEMHKRKVIQISAQITTAQKEITNSTNSQAVLKSNIKQKTQDKTKKQDLIEHLKVQEAKYAKYPSVIQGFSSTGIPNLIIQDVLDELQLEANNLLNQLKPGLQLSFLVEKTKEDGDVADTLDIKYYLNGKERYYEQLSGAMRLAVAFALKLGLSFVLQNRLGTEIKFLLLDEIDQSLDKASVDAFSEIVKCFQQEFIILVITHNDQLKDKFNHAILVEQDMNMVSRAKVVSSW
jgi:DNA repair exonuclease SbcCD ATPase subunit